MISLILIIHMAGFSCQAPLFLNKTGQPWTDFDRDEMLRAPAICRKMPQTPCLGQFTKGPRRNEVICVPFKPKGDL
jgi:hypothetical protein